MLLPLRLLLLRLLYLYYDYCDDDHYYDHHGGLRPLLLLLRPLRLPSPPHCAALRDTALHYYDGCCHCDGGDSSFNLRRLLLRLLLHFDACDLSTYRLTCLRPLF